jgi:lipid-A-disaccharide synthase-like uncharacterized protein
MKNTSSILFMLFWSFMSLGGLVIMFIGMHDDNGVVVCQGMIMMWSGLILSHLERIEQKIDGD